jgi:hypothetical protein
MVAVGRQADEVVRHLNTVRAFDELDGTARRITDGREQLRVRTLFVGAKEGGAAAKRRARQA